MSIGILGKKLGMSQFFDEQGKAVPVLHVYRHSWEEIGHVPVLR